MAILVIGITMLNNYEKMQSMERVLYQISGKMDDATEVAADADAMQDQAVQDALLTENAQAADQTAQMTAGVQELPQAADTVEAAQDRRDRCGSRCEHSRAGRSGDGRADNGRAGISRADG